MARFGVDAQQVDPYRNFEFRVKWDGRYVAGAGRIEGLGPATGVGRRREGGESSSSAASPGRAGFDAITLERGVTHDAEFERWASTVRDVGAGAGPGMSPVDVTIERRDVVGRVVTVYRVFRCWVSEFQALPDLDGNADAVTIQRITLENEGWERDVVVTDP